MSGFARGNSTSNSRIPEDIRNFGATTSDTTGTANLAAINLTLSTFPDAYVPGGTFLVSGPVVVPVNKTLWTTEYDSNTVTTGVSAVIGAAASFPAGVGGVVQLSDQSITLGITVDGRGVADFGHSFCTSSSTIAAASDGVDLGTHPGTITVTNASRLPAGPQTAQVTVTNASGVGLVTTTVTYSGIAGNVLTLTAWGTGTINTNNPIIVASTSNARTYFSGSRAGVVVSTYFSGAQCWLWAGNHYGGSICSVFQGGADPVGGMFRITSSGAQKYIFWLDGSTGHFSIAHITGGGGTTVATMRLTGSKHTFTSWEVDGGVCTLMFADGGNNNDFSSLMFSRGGGVTENALITYGENTADQVIANAIRGVHTNPFGGGSWNFLAQWTATTAASVAGNVIQSAYVSINNPTTPLNGTVPVDFRCDRVFCKNGNFYTPVVPTQDVVLSQITGNVAITAGAAAATIHTISLPAGVWMVMATLTIRDTAGTAARVTAILTDGTTNYATEGFCFTTNPNDLSLSLQGLFKVNTSAATINTKIASQTSNVNVLATVGDASPAANTATSITAYRVQ